MTVKIDEDVQAVLEFIQSRFQASRLVAVAEGVARLAPNLWGHHPKEEVFPLQLKHDPISTGRKPAISK